MTLLEKQVREMAANGAPPRVIMLELGINKEEFRARYNNNFQSGCLRFIKEGLQSKKRGRPKDTPETIRARLEKRREYSRKTREKLKAQVDAGDPAAIEKYNRWKTVSAEKQRIYRETQRIKRLAIKERQKRAKEKEIKEKTKKPPMPGWNPFPEYYPIEKGKFAVEVVISDSKSYGTCEWNGKRWTKPNFSTVQVWKVVAFMYLDEEG